MASVMSTALSRLNAFLDSEMETILCNDTKIDAGRFCNEKSAIFIIMPEEDSSKYFMVSLLIQQLYCKILAVADENKGNLKNRFVFYCDEFGTLPKIESAEMMFSATRSSRDSIVPIIQSIAQLEKNYDKESAAIIIDATQLTVFGGFTPNSESAQTLSKSLGTKTVLSRSMSQSGQRKMIQFPMAAWMWQIGGCQSDRRKKHEIDYQTAWKGGISMNWFQSIYSDELPSRAVSVYMYLVDRTNADGQC